MGIRMSEEDLLRLQQKKGFKISVQTKGAFDLSDPPKVKKSKYKNQKVYVYPCGLALTEKKSSLGKPVMVFDSIKEHRRYTELLLLQESGKIKGLTRQVNLLIQEDFICDGEKIKPIYYRADFMYINNKGQTVIEDVKGYDEKTESFITTSDFRLKWKLLKFRYPEKLFLIV